MAFSKSDRDYVKGKLASIRRAVNECEKFGMSDYHYIKSLDQIANEARLAGDRLRRDGQLCLELK